MYGLRQAVVAATGGGLDHINIHTMYFWKVTRTLAGVRAMTEASVDELEPFPLSRTVRQWWDEEEPQDGVNAFVFVVWETGGSKRKRSPSVSEEVDVESRHKRSQDMALTKGLQIVPSSTSTPSNLQALQSGKVTLLNGRGGKTGPPIALFHEIFDTFQRRLGTPITPALDDIQTLQEIKTRSLPIYNEERDRIETIKSRLDRLFGEGDLEAHGGKGRVDVRWQTSTKKGQTAYPLFCEVKKELGVGTSEPGIQGLLTYWSCIAAQKMEPPLVKASCCPSFVLVVSGPYFAIFGVVFLERVVSEHLTPGYLYLGDDDNLKYLVVLKECVAQLKGWYMNTEFESNPSRFFPRFNSYPNVPGSPSYSSFTYDRPLEPLSTTVPIPKQKPIYSIWRGLDPDGTSERRVVKFVESYGEEVHALLAEHGLAPKLHHVSPEPLTPGGLRMVVMDLVVGVTASPLAPVPRQIIKEIERALKIIHEKGFVFGDLRRPNIIIGPDRSTAKLIDFDWAGKAGEACYPHLLNSAIQWDPTVKGGGKITKAHDEFMLSRLEHAEPM